ncbi:MAG: excinuclease ABC subunit UvrA, partial [Kiritimatiellia bacterium]
MSDCIRVRGAAGHNLRSIDVDIPRNQLTVVTGVSGSGKSTLAFDTLFAEGQRRYVESLSAYARQFLDQLQKPVVDRIDGLSPAIAIEQRHGGANPRSTVATTTEIHDFLRLLYANAGIAHCPGCGVVLRRYPAEEVVERLLGCAAGTKCVLLSPQPDVTNAAMWKRSLADIRKRGYLRLWVDGVLLELEQAEKQAVPDSYALVVDRLVLRDDDMRTRLTDSVELAMREGNGRLCVRRQEPGKDAWQESVFSEDLVCESCDIRFRVLTPRDFSFNSPHGACPTCDGLGTEQVFDADLLIPDVSVALDKGAIPAWRIGGRALVSYYRRMLKSFMTHFAIAPGTPVRALDPHVRAVLMEGSDTIEMRFTGPRRTGGRIRTARFEGVIPNLQRRYRETESEAVRTNLRRFMTRHTCPACGGGRLRPESAACRFHGITLVELLARPVEEVLGLLDALVLQGQEAEIAGELVREIRHRVHFLQEAGLGYLTLDRQSSTLSGGEAQRLRLASQLGAGLTGVLYVLDEPTIGLHDADNARLIRILQQLRDGGNTVVVVEHDETMIQAADYVLDLGPGAGPGGGTVMFSGTVDALRRSDTSITARYIRGEEPRCPAHVRLSPDDPWLEVKGAAVHNLKQIDVAFPLGRMVCVSGVSGSGKSSLVHDVISCALARRLQPGSAMPPGKHASITGLEHLNKMIEIDQSPIGRSPRSNPVTYTGAFDPIRKLFAATPSARVRGYDVGRFSFNRK